MTLRPFTAPAWARNPHVQTSWSTLVRRQVVPPRVRVRLELPDGDFVDTDWTDDDRAAPLVVVLHGLAGSGDSAYVIGIQHALRRAGIGSVVMHFRGAGGEPNRLARGYHSGDTDDLRFLMQVIATRFPGRTLGIAGYSLGGNVTLKWLGEEGTQAPVVAACAVSVPFELAPCATRLDAGFSRAYRDRLCGELVTNLLRKEQVLRAAGSTQEADRIRALGDLSSIRSFWEFDGRVIAPLHGFRDAADYYAQSGARPFMRHIRVPTLVIHALDDPFMTPAVVPRDDEVSPSVQMLVSRHGGHVGFVQGTPWQPHYWLEETIPSFFCRAFAMSASGPASPGFR